VRAVDGNTPDCGLPLSASVFHVLSLVYKNFEEFMWWEDNGKVSSRSTASLPGDVYAQFLITLQSRY
jgi:hypothetical protein